MQKKIIFLFLFIFFYNIDSLQAETLDAHTLYSDSTAPYNYKSCPLLGVDVELNYGYSSFAFAVHRPNIFGLYSLSRNHIQQKEDSFSPTVAYDFYPYFRTPLRFQLNYLYSDIDFKLNPFIVNAPMLVSASDRVLIRSLMATLFIDWHTCTRLIPYTGISLGSTNLKTYHTVNYPLRTLPSVSTNKDSNYSLGGTLGIRYFFNNTFYTNLQLRYDLLGPIHFKDKTPLSLNPLLQSADFLSDYLHETSLLLGLGFVF